MTTIFSDGSLHPGRDPNDAHWLELRRPEDWAGATTENVVFDGARPGISLTPRSLAGFAALEAHTAEGSSFRADPDRNVVLRRGCPGAEWTRLLGGPGHETGKVRRPMGLALDARGLLLIADSGNHRVQVVRSEDGAPVTILGSVDAWGRGVPPNSRCAHPHALREPVAVASGSRLFAVADRAAGTIHVYDDRFVFLRAFTPRPPSAPTDFTAQPVAVAIIGDRLWVLDAGWSVPAAYTPCGEPVAGGFPEALSGWSGASRFAAHGVVVHGPIAASEGTVWHRVIVDAELPEGTSVELQTFASEDPTPPEAIAWAPASPVPLPLTGVEPRDGAIARLVLSDHGRWQRKRSEPYRRALRPLYRFAGTGPHASAALSLPWQVARRLRRGDRLELRQGADVEARDVASIAGREVRGAVRGARRVYGEGSRVTLLLREGREPLGGPVVLAELSAGESLDLSASADDGTLYELAASHSVAALLRDGDVVELTDVTSARAVVSVDSLASQPAALTLTAAISADFSSASLRVLESVGRLMLDELPWTDGVPSGEPIRIHAAEVPSVSAAIRWADVELATLWLAPGVVVPYATWTHFTLPEPVATDRGRFLWVRLRLSGRAEHAGAVLSTATPLIRSVRLLLPRPSLLRWLPEVFSRRDADDPSGALFLERLLALPEACLTGIETSYESLLRELNPEAASDEWLQFLGAWFGLVFDPSWPIERRRALLVSAHELFALRGTLAGLRRYLEIYTGSTPAIIEGYRWGAAPSAVVGTGLLLGHAPLGSRSATKGERAHHFTLWVFGDGGACSTPLIERAARAIVDSVKPAHTSYDLHVVDAAPRVGIGFRIGVDTVLLGAQRSAAPLAAHALNARLGALPLAPRGSGLGAPSLDSLVVDSNLTLT